MNKAEKLQFLLNFIKSNSNISVKKYLEFAEANEINQLMARRYLKELQKFHYVKLELGFLTTNEKKDFEFTRLDKTNKNVQAKQIIAKKAQEYLSDDKIFVSPGTTLEHFVKEINKPILYLYTNGLEILNRAYSNEKIDRVFCTGGRLRPQSLAFAGMLAIKFLENINVPLAFVSGTNIDNNGYLCNNHPEEAETIKTIIKQSKKVICLVDSSKYFKDGLNRIAHISEFDTIITEKNDLNLDEFKNIANIVIAGE